VFFVVNWNCRKKFKELFKHFLHLSFIHLLNARWSIFMFFFLSQNNLHEAHEHFSSLCFTIDRSIETKISIPSTVWKNVFQKKNIYLQPRLSDLVKWHFLPIFTGFYGFYEFLRVFTGFYEFLRVLRVFTKFLRKNNYFFPPFSWGLNHQKPSKI
jgi:hypothetical protein